MSSDTRFEDMTREQREAVMTAAGARRYAYKGTERFWDLGRGKWRNEGVFWREGEEPLTVIWFTDTPHEVALEIGEPWWLVPDEDTALPFRPCDADKGNLIFN